MALQGLREMGNLLLQLLLTSESSANNSDAEFFPASLRKLNMCPIAQSFRKDENNDDQIFLNFVYPVNKLIIKHISHDVIRSALADEENTFSNANQAEFI